MSKKILVADDEPHILGLLTFVLEKEGYTILSASDGEEAIKKAREERPDLIFLDVMMPKKNGYEVCQELKADPQTKDIHIILLTAKGQELDKKRGIELGAVDYATKPFSPTLTIKRVKEILGE